MAVRAVALAILALVLAAPPAHAQTIEEQQWHLGALGIYDAHTISRGAGVVVGVVDSGVDKTRPDLADQVLPGNGFGTAAGTDGTDDRDGHGTAMATLIAGRAVDGGALGIAPDAKILPVSVGADGERFTTGSVSSGVTWAVDHGARVVNLSLTTESTITADLRRAVTYAMDHDVVVVAGTGNDGAHHVGAPANIRGVLAVSGTVEAGTPWPSSNTGPETVLAAPAEGIVTAVPLSVSDSGYAGVDGTSASTALVSGVAALVRAKFPEMTAGDVVNRLIVSATDQGAVGRDDVTGFGVVNPVGALTMDIPHVPRNPLAPTTTTTPPTTTAASSVIAQSPTEPPVDRATRVAVAGGHRRHR
jgi:type VII secretion-associated serine protease mycosin